MNRTIGFRAKALAMALTALTAFTALTAVSAAAQNNSYGIDDECYTYLNQSELLLGKPGFKEVNAALLQKAVEKGDTKAQTLYYVQRLKDATYTYRKQAETTPAQDEEVIRKAEDLKRVAQDLGYPQYYYYAYELEKNHFHNHGQTSRAMDIVMEMRDKAVADDDEYGIWMGNRSLISHYVGYNDYISAKAYLREAIKIFETTTDPVIRRQSGTPLYCDMADTFPIGHDSVKVYLSKAIDSRKVHLDTLRCHYHLAKLSAYEKNIPQYELSRDYCLDDPFLYRVSPSARILFSDLDILVYDRAGQDELVDDVDRLKIREVKYMANIAEHFGHDLLAFEIEKKLVVRNERYLSEMNRGKLAELNARLGNDVLKRQVGVQSKRASDAFHVAMILVIVILLGTIVFFIIHSRSLRKAKRRDEEMIAVLQEANEKVRLADAAKTRFVQNMSHEVRTPLNAIVGFSQLLALPDGTFPEEEKEEFSGHIISNTKMLTMLLDDILNASAMDKGEYKITYEQGEMHYMANAAISSAEHRLQPGVKLYYVPESPEPFNFTTDPRRVQQILINLITNSCKHTKQGEIKVTSSLTARPDYVTYAVTDTGPGVPADQAEKIFERFTKLNDYVQGTGLGLSICRDIAGRMGAKVFLDTTYTEGGARFILEVPVNPPVAEPAK